MNIEKQRSIAAEIHKQTKVLNDLLTNACAEGLCTSVRVSEKTITTLPGYQLTSLDVEVCLVL